MLDRLDVLPEPQQAALRVALGLESGDRPDRFLVALAGLSLVSAIAEDQPLVCVIDDFQWLDKASAQVLEFVARRLLAESAMLLFAIREPSAGNELAGLLELRLRGLEDVDARALLEMVVRGRIDERVRDRIVAEMHGNPLALRELPRGLSAAELAGGFALPASGPISSTIEAGFRRRVDALPPETRHLLHGFTAYERRPTPRTSETDDIATSTPFGSRSNGDRAARWLRRAGRVGVSSPFSVVSSRACLRWPVAPEPGLPLRPLLVRVVRRIALTDDRSDAGCASTYPGRGPRCSTG